MVVHDVMKGWTRVRPGMYVKELVGNVEVIKGVEYPVYKIIVKCGQKWHTGFRVNDTCRYNTPVYDTLADAKRGYRRRG